jgi:hypothetical protein
MTRGDEVTTIVVRTAELTHPVTQYLTSVFSLFS